MDYLTQALLDGHITITHVVQVPQLDHPLTIHIPQLDELGVRIMEQLQAIRDAVQAAGARLNATLSTELTQIAAKLATATAPEEIQAVVADITALSDSLNQRIADIIPDEPPA